MRVSRLNVVQIFIFCNGYFVCLYHLFVLAFYSFLFVSTFCCFFVPLFSRRQSSRISNCALRVAAAGQWSRNWRLPTFLLLRSFPLDLFCFVFFLICSICFVLRAIRKSNPSLSAVFIDLCFLSVCNNEIKISLLLVQLLCCDHFLCVSHCLRQSKDYHFILRQVVSDYWWQGGWSVSTTFLSSTVLSRYHMEVVCYCLPSAGLQNSLWNSNFGSKLSWRNYSFLLGNFLYLCVFRVKINSTLSKSTTSMLLVKISLLKKTKALRRWDSYVRKWHLLNDMCK